MTEVDRQALYPTGWSLQGPVLPITGPVGVYLMTEVDRQALLTGWSFPGPVLPPNRTNWSLSNN
jgi:hypothetical protein